MEQNGKHDATPSDDLLEQIDQLIDKIEQLRQENKTLKAERQQW